MPLWDTTWKCLKKLRIELSYDPAIHNSGYPKNTSLIQKHPYIDFSIVYNSQDTEIT